jgi:hypothetical protein
MNAQDKAIHFLSVETIGEAYRLGWRIRGRCAFGTRDGMNVNSL